MQINKLREQILFRDELIDEARQMMKSAGINRHLEDDRIVKMDDIIYDQPITTNLRGDGREQHSSQLRNYQPSRVSQASMSPRRPGNYTNKKPTYADRSERQDAVGGRGNYYGNVNREPSQGGFRRDQSDQKYGGYQRRNYGNANIPKG